MRRALKKVPIKRINEVKNDEYVRISGRVMNSSNGLAAPLSGRPCTYHHTLVTRKNGKNRETLIDNEEAINFFVHSDGGVALVNVLYYKGFLVKDGKFKSGFLDDVEENMDELLQRFGHSSTNFFGFNHSIQYNEGVLEPGEEVTVAGFGEWVPNTFKEVPPEVKQVLILDGSVDNPVLISDDPGMIEDPDTEAISQEQKRRVEEMKPDPISFEKTDVPKETKKTPTPESSSREKEEEDNRSERKSERRNRNDRKGRYLK
ncbi:hypothetical protein KFE98_15585 [bacterium SCSIO 12741]|nr:hypothetical protein KFE98_15585 [bacterium SCSIO 12741]